MAKEPTGNVQIDGATLAEAIRTLMNPSVEARLVRETRPPGREQVRVPVVSPTGAKFTAVIELGRTRAAERDTEPSKRSFIAPEPMIRSIEDYHYPWAAEIEEVAPNYHPPLKFWKGRKYDGFKGLKREAVVGENGKLRPGSPQQPGPMQQLYDETWKTDLRTWPGMTIAQAKERGLTDAPKAEVAK